MFHRENKFRGKKLTLVVIDNIFWCFKRFIFIMTIITHLSHYKDTGILSLLTIILILEGRTV